jgi:peptidyl-prolyl cis-trans isomerase SurA
LKLMLRAVVVSLLAIPFALAHAQAPASKPGTKRPAPATTPATKSPGSRGTPSPTAAPPGQAAPARLDGIAAVVNDEVILESDVEEQLYLFLSQARIKPDSAMVDSMRSEVLNQLIDFRIVVSEAKRQGLALNAGDEKLISKQAEESIQQTRARFQSEQEFQQALQRDNTSVPKLREKYRHDLTEQVLAERLKDKSVPKHPVTQTEAEAFFKANPDKFPHVPAQVKIQVIQIPPAADSVADRKARAKILDIRKRLMAGEKFAKVAAEVSEDENTARSGGDLGFLPHGALDVSLEQAIAAAKLNTLGGPVRSSAGWHLFEVLERDTMKTQAGKDSTDRLGQPMTESHIRHILIRVPLGEDDIARARSIAEKVRGEAAKGSDFGSLARRHSKYQGQADPDGDLGYVSLGAFQPNIRSAIESLPVGAVSDVLENPVGFNIFKVNDRKPERPYQLDEVRDQLRSAVEDIKDHDRWESWIKSLRDKAHIEIRGS